MWSINTATIVLFLCSTGTTLTSGYLWTTLVVNHNEDLSFYSPPLRLHSHGRITLSRRLHLRWCRWSLRRRLWEKSPFSIALGQVKELPIQPQARVSSLPFSFARSLYCSRDPVMTSRSQWFWSQWQHQPHSWVHVQIWSTWQFELQYCLLLLRWLHLFSLR